MRTAVWSCIVIAAVAGAAGAEGSQRVFGATAALGDGRVTSYADLDADGAPLAIGVAFESGSLEGLPTEPSDGKRCFDENGDGTMDLATECSAWHERPLPLPAEVKDRPDVPFKWALLNWNPLGHAPPGVFDKPHFDVHFYIEPATEILAIERGPCGPEKVRCDQFETARTPVPDNYLPTSYVDLGLVAPAMGNHLINLADHDFHGHGFTRHWVYGAWAGRVAFWEEMLTLAYLKSNPDYCYDIPLPEAYAAAGWYPTQSCIRGGGKDGVATVSLEGFERRAASPAGAPRQPPPPPPAQ